MLSSLGHSLRISTDARAGSRPLAWTHFGGISLLAFFSLLPDSFCQEILHQWPMTNRISVIRGGEDIDGDGRPDLLITSARSPGFVFLYSGASGALLLELLGSRPDEDFGTKVAFAVDLDGNGEKEILVGLPDATSPGRNSGAVERYNIPSGQWLATVDGQSSSDHFGFDLVDVGDTDSDGVSDFLVSASAWGATSNRGRVYLYSGSTASLRYWKTGQVGDVLRRTWRAGDLDQDGSADFMVGGFDLIRVFSGASGSRIRAHHTDWSELAITGDLTADGVPDYLIGTSQGVHLHSGADGSLLRTHGDLVSPLILDGDADVNGDGFRDYLVGLPHKPSSPERIRKIFLYSGKSQRPLFVFESEPGIHAAQFVGDVNGDGLDDLAIGSGPGVASPYLASVIAGNEIYLQVVPQVVAAYQPVDVWIRGGNPGALTALFLLEVNGSPRPRLLALGTFNVLGEFRLSGQVAPGLSGFDLTLGAVGFAQPGSNQLVASAPFTVQVR